MFEHCDEDIDSILESNMDDEFNNDLITLRDFLFIFVSENMIVFMMYWLVAMEGGIHYEPILKVSDR
ncbi:Tetratricopeptide-like helical [Penicillium malachiteum]|nr:Tetratricopeptide-like helical [Penicillium malachiteum]